jgi:hypothetical protein
MSNSIFGLLSFNPALNGVATDLSDDTVKQMKQMPPLLEGWQQEDLANNSVDGYFMNPLANTIIVFGNLANTILINANSVVGTTQNISNLIFETSNIANTLAFQTIDGFLYHTNRLSNVIPPDENIVEPHFETATGIGKIITYIVAQTDNVQNNAPMIGSFGSLFIENTLNEMANTANSITTLFLNTINVGNSNISLSNAQALYNAYSNIYATMTSFRNSDNVFFQNSAQILNNYSKVRNFSNMGQTEIYLIKEKIGTPKIQSRLNS